MAPICIHFQRGNCKRGTECSFSHDLATGQFPQGDWLCPGCGDTQFARNSQCRQCGTPKPLAPGQSPTPVLNLDAIVPAQPEEVEQFLILNPVEEKACMQFRTMDPRAQRICINKGTLQGARDSTAAFIGRMSQVRRLVESGMSGAAAQAVQQQQQMMGGQMMGGQMMGGQNMGSSPSLDQVAPAMAEEVEAFLMMNPVEGKVQDQFRNMDPRAQRLVLNRGGLEGSRDPTAAFIGRIVKIDQLVKSQYAGNDWICPSCGDTQFGRNLQCRKCAHPRPAANPMLSAGSFAGAMAGAGGMAGGYDMTGAMAMAGGCAGLDPSFGGCGMAGGCDMTGAMAMAGGCAGLDPSLGGDAGAFGAFGGFDPSGGAGGFGAMRGGMMQQQQRASPYGQQPQVAMSAAPDLSQVQPATPVEVEEFLILNPVEQKAADQFRRLDPRAQRLILNRGSLEGARDPTACFIGRLSKIQRLVSGGAQIPAGDWLCPGCGDQQFARNAQCRRCGTPKPMVGY